MLREIWRRNWQIDALAIILIVVVVAFFTYAEARQHLADQRQHQADVRAEKQRKAICAILANIPGNVPAEIVNARRVFARPGDPTDCQPVVHPKPTTVTVTPTPRPASASAPPSLTPAGVTPTPTVTRTVTPAPSRTPTPHPTPSRSPSPSPRPTCVHAVITVCT